jgi:hypothetical protein
MGAEEADLLCPVGAKTNRIIRLPRVVRCKGSVASPVATIRRPLGARSVLFDFDHCPRIWCNVAMLGRLKKTTRLDVGLALCFAGLAYLVWAFIAGVCRTMMRDMILTTQSDGRALSALPKVVEAFFVDWGFVIDIAGVIWMALSLFLIVQSSRQKLSISWPWATAMLQSLVAAMGSLLVGFAIHQQEYAPHAPSGGAMSLGRQVSMISWPLILAIAIFIWVTLLVYLLVERARLNRRGPSLRDGMRSNIYR